MGDYLDVNNEDYSFVSSNKTLEVIGSMDDMYICLYVIGFKLYCYPVSGNWYYNIALPHRAPV